MSRYVPKILREKVAIRAGFRCEYCRMPESAALVRFQVEHIISIQHGGKTAFANLAWACPICNSNKGPNVGTILFDQNEDHFVRFFDPRKHLWAEYFEIKNGQILGKTLIGLGTSNILCFNEIDRILERIELLEAGIYY